MAILKIRDADGNVIEIPAIKGKTPVKGVDYFTAEDIQEIVNAVLAALPRAEEASF